MMKHKKRFREDGPFGGGGDGPGLSLSIREGRGRFIAYVSVVRDYTSARPTPATLGAQTLSGLLAEVEQWVRDNRVFDAIDGTRADPAAEPRRSRPELRTYRVAIE